VQDRFDAVAVSRAELDACEIDRVVRTTEIHDASMYPSTGLTGKSNEWPLSAVRSEPGRSMKSQSHTFRMSERHTLEHPQPDGRG
jgi:hypothetical protein